MITHKKVSLFFMILLLLLLFFRFQFSIDFWWFIFIVLIWLGTNAFGSARISSNYHIAAFCNNPNETQKKIALTFDDGPSNFTPKVLDILKKFDIKATFFCIGKNIENHKEIVRQIVSEGHHLGNHSYSHSVFFDFYNENKIRKEIEKTDAIIMEIISKKINFFRPPYGVTTPSVARAIRKTNHKVIGWSIRSFDGGTKNKKRILGRITKNISSGGIVLLHDTAQHSVEVLECFLQFLLQNNYKVVSVEELLNLKAYED